MRRCRQSLPCGAEVQKGRANNCRRHAHEKNKAKEKD